MTEVEPTSPPVERSLLQRAAWLVLGHFFVALGGLGILLPGLPTTPFLLLAAACFARSSPRLYAWLLANKTFGPMIDDYRAGRGVRMHVKIAAVSTMVLFVTFALLIPLRGRTTPSVIVFVCAAVGAIYVLRLPTRVDDDAT